MWTIWNIISADRKSGEEVKSRDSCEIFHFSKTEFKSAIEKITKMKITERENNYLFKMVDANKDGVIDVENELNLNICCKRFSRRE